ncbi:hypothetical protein EKK58_11880 [Candidatus Dependentiae bacterium]|nr:MAG: hypothetical protein EKK58_11880 [Candidatus Dependentiae bacterium]
MKNPLYEEAYDASTYDDLRHQILNKLATTDPTTPEYGQAFARLNELDEIVKRPSGRFEAALAASGPVAAVVGIYLVQQFGGILVPKVLETFVSRRT